MVRYWILVGHTPIEVEAEEWGPWFQNHTEDRTVGVFEHDGVRLSTVFLGVDHSFEWPEPAIPTLFESMVFGGDYDGYQQRYRVLEEARDGHLMAAARLLAGKKPW